LSRRLLAIRSDLTPPSSIGPDCHREAEDYEADSKKARKRLGDAIVVEIEHVQSGLDSCHEPEKKHDHGAEQRKTGTASHSTLPIRSGPTVGAGLVVSLHVRRIFAAT
jgi:hypothetical protein